MGSPHPFDDDLDDWEPVHPRQRGCLPVDLMLLAVLFSMLFFAAVIAGAL